MGGEPVHATTVSTTAGRRRRRGASTPWSRPTLADIEPKLTCVLVFGDEWSSWAHLRADLAGPQREYEPSTSRTSVPRRGCSYVSISLDNLHADGEVVGKSAFVDGLAHASERLGSWVLARSFSSRAPTTRASMAVRPNVPPASAMTARVAHRLVVVESD